jgi:sphingomyelin phosphodiesterase
VIRYESIIKAQFYGHTHNDETAIFFDSSEDPPRPANSYFIGVSTTAYTDINPGYKVFHADGGRGEESTWEIMDHETFIYNLTEANNAPVGSALPWKKLYGAKETFGLKSFRPVDLYDLAYRMLFDDTLFQNYWKAYQKDSHTKNKCTSDECMLDYVCDMVIANSGDYSHCEKMQRFHTEGPTEATTPGPTQTPGSGSSMKPIMVTLIMLVLGVVVL